MMLSKDETTIGRAETCDIGLFGDNTIEQLHARILLKGNRYLLADAEHARRHLPQRRARSPSRRRCSPAT